MFGFAAKKKRNIKVICRVQFMFKVVGTETYLKELGKWPKADREVAEKMAKKLAESPLAGKPLGYPFLREKKIREKRIYFLVYEELKLVMLVATSSKKDQQVTIDHIKEYLAEYKRIAEEVSRQVV